MAETMVEIEGMKRYYEMVSGTVKALDGIDLRVEEGERIILLGPSGSGKTTLLNCIAALDSPTSGSYSFQDKDVPRNSPEEMTTFRRENIGYVFQFFNLLQDLTVLENILLIQELAGVRDENRARELLSLVGLEEEVDRFPTEISGGQQQRVAIARSLAKKPKLLLGDELTGNLDTKTSSMVMEVLVKACEAEGITTVFVTHDESLIRYATRVIRLDSGIVITDKDA
ncbi:MAG: ABC transporter ATP-binding protein [Candidatus Thermoplasmatota archaeon]|nr:ABC transporter ATP-binding protein [Candidatus Thermoplasmatota archaeon]